jgi:hypothetical protein
MSYASDGNTHKLSRDHESVCMPHVEFDDDDDDRRINAGSSPWLTLRRFFGLRLVELGAAVEGGGDCESVTDCPVTSPASAEPST